MELRTVNQNGHTIAIVHANETIITDVPSALDFLASVRYEADTDRIALNKEALSEDFFELRTKLAGEVLQKFVNYYAKLAIHGDFSIYTSKALKDFIYECNNGRHIFFTATQDEAIEKLAAAR
ncbi:MAG: DUF4180 domain-containing protein [Christensenellaceae bacterium]